MEILVILLMERRTPRSTSMAPRLFSSVMSVTPYRDPILEHVRPTANGLVHNLHAKVSYPFVLSNSFLRRGYSDRAFKEKELLNFQLLTVVILVHRLMASGMETHSPTRALYYWNVTLSTNLLATAEEPAKQMEHGLVLSPPVRVSNNSQCSE